MNLTRKEEMETQISEHERRGRRHLAQSWDVIRNSLNTRQHLWVNGVNGMKSGRQYLNLKQNKQTCVSGVSRLVLKQNY